MVNIRLTDFYKDCCFWVSFIKLDYKHCFMKCGICGKKIETTFLDKILGGYVRDKSGKKHAVCSECQKKHAKKEELLKNLK